MTKFLDFAPLSCSVAEAGSSSSNINENQNNDLAAAKVDSSITRGSGIASILEQALTMLGKATVPKLIDLIGKYGPKDGSGVEIHEFQDSDVETTVQTALDVIWKSQGGDWAAFIKVLESELKDVAEEASGWMKESAMLGNQLSEKQIKDLIFKHGGPEAMPKLKLGRGPKGRGGRKRATKTGEKYQGTLLKGDYLAALLDTLRELNGNDFALVAEVLKQDIERGGAGAQKRRKGFGGRHDPSQSPKPEVEEPGEDLSWMPGGRG
jgi:hypothetical protein